MITERTLKRWRADALTTKVKCTLKDTLKNEHCERILRMTQELLDLYLIERIKGCSKNIQHGK